MRVAIYARVSTEGQEKQETINSQLVDLRNYATQNNMDIFEEYTDNGYSGELLERPDLDRLRDDARAKLFDTVLIHSSDRLSRKYAHLIWIKEQLEKYGVSVVFLDRPDTKDTPEENLFGGMRGLFSEYEKAKILDRTRRGKMGKAREGIIVSGTPPYGYKLVSGKYEVDPDQAKVVRLIYELFIDERMKIRSIAKELSARNVPSRTASFGSRAASIEC